MKRLTRQQAIAAMCKACIYDPESGTGTWKEQTAQCTAPGCPLWPYRPRPVSGAWSFAPTDPKDYVYPPVPWHGKTGVLGS